MYTPVCLSFRPLVADFVKIWYVFKFIGIVMQ